MYSCDGRSMRRRVLMSDGQIIKGRDCRDSQARLETV